MNTVYEQRASTILHHLLRSNASPGRWILPANVCPIVPLTFLKAGAPFELVDLDPDTLCLDGRETLARVRRDPASYAGVLYVHTYGREQPADVLFQSLRAAAPGLLAVDDRCLCDPSFEAPATSADVVLYSTGYAKPVDLAGGGYAFIGGHVDYEPVPLRYEADDLERLEASSKRDLAARRRIGAAPGDWLDASEPRTGFDDYRAAVESALERARSHRAELREIYRSRLPGWALLPLGDWRTHLRVPDRDRLVAALFEAGLYAGTHYAALTGVFAAGEAPVAEALHADVVNLFDDRYFSAAQAERACDVILRHLD